MKNILQTKRMRILLCAGIFLLAGLAGTCARPLEILFVGNSYVYVNNLPEVFAKAAAGAGLEPQVVAVVNLVGPLGFEPRTKGLCLPLRLSPPVSVRGLDHAFTVSRWGGI